MLLRFLSLGISTTRSIASRQVKLGLVLEENVTAPSIPKSDNRVEFGLGFVRRVTENEPDGGVEINEIFFVPEYKC